MRIPGLLVVCGLAAASACADGAPPPAGSATARVVTSIHPLAAIARALAGPDIQVVSLLPPGAHADTFEPTPGTARAVADADLIVRVGAGLDGWVATSQAGGRQLVLSDDLVLRGRAGPGSGNPHVWLDPLLVRDHILPRLATALAEVAPGEGPAIRERARAFGDSLTALHHEIAGLLADAPTRRFVAAHPAWVYFADRYGLEQVGVVHPSPGEEIGTRELARLVHQAASRGVRAVIAEPQLGRAGVAAVADELDVAVEVADPIGGPGAEGRAGYLELMRWNARAFARALGAAP